MINDDPRYLLIDFLLDGSLSRLDIFLVFFLLSDVSLFTFSEQIQSFVKMWLTRRKYQTRLSFFRCNVSLAVIFIVKMTQKLSSSCSAQCEQCYFLL